MTKSIMSSTIIPAVELLCATFISMDRTSHVDNCITQTYHGIVETI